MRLTADSATAWSFVLWQASLRKGCDIICVSQVNFSSLSLSRQCPRRQVQSVFALRDSTMWAPMWSINDRAIGRYWVVGWVSMYLRSSTASSPFPRLVQLRHQTFHAVKPSAKLMRVARFQWTFSVSAKDIQYVGPTGWLIAANSVRASAYVDVVSLARSNRGSLAVSTVVSSVSPLT